MELIEWSQFESVKMRVGTILEVQPFPEARRPALKLVIDFGPLGLKKTSAQITELYSPEKLIGRQIVAVVNFPTKQIGPFMSEVLVLGALTESGVVLLNPDQKVPNGSAIG